jgi:hypothetical protein
MSEGPSFLDNIIPITATLYEEQAAKKLASVKESLLDYKLLSLTESKQVSGADDTQLLEIPYYDIPSPQEYDPAEPRKKLNIKRWRVFSNNVRHWGNRRYHQLEGSRSDVYAPLKLNIPDFYDVSAPLFITEGELKTMSLINYGYTAVGVPGIAHFKCTYENKLFGLLEKIPWGKTVYLVPDKEVPEHDSENKIKPDCAYMNVMAAVGKLASMLAVRGAKVLVIQFEGPGKIQVDDYLAREGSLEELIEKARPWDARKDMPEIGLRRLASEFVMMGGKVYSSATWEAMTEANFKAQYKHILDKDRKPIVNNFSMNKYTTKVKGLDYDPSRIERVLPNGSWNLWHGWLTKPVKGDLSDFDSKMEVLFSEEPELLHEYYLTLAMMIQKPWVKQQRFLLFRSSAEGVGKSLLLEMPMMLINGTSDGSGRKELRYNHAIMDGCGKLLESNFNGLLIGVSYLVMNEVDDFFTKKVSNFIKALVTDSQLQINEKFLAQRMIDNHLLLAITTNERSLFQIGATSRRPLVLPCIEAGSELDYKIQAMWQKAKATDFFKDYRSLRFRQAMMYRLMTYDLGGYDGTQSPPLSLSKLSLAEDNMSDLEAYCYEELADVGAVNPNAEYERYRHVSGDTQLKSKVFKGALKINRFSKPNLDKTAGQVIIPAKYTETLRHISGGRNSLVVWVKEHLKKEPAEVLIRELVKRYARKV